MDEKKKKENDEMYNLNELNKNIRILNDGEKEEKKQQSLLTTLTESLRVGLDNELTANLVVSKRDRRFVVDDETNSITNSSSNLVSSCTDSTASMKMLSNGTPILSDLLISDAMTRVVDEALVLKFDDLKRNRKTTTTAGEGETFRKLNDLNNNNEPSTSINDYFNVTFQSTRQLEASGADNALFLLLARAILYKLNFTDPTYQRFLRMKVFYRLVRKDYRFDSDVQLQQLIRKRLCLHWLSFVIDGKLKHNCKYSR